MTTSYYAEHCLGYLLHVSFHIIFKTAMKSLSQGASSITTSCELVKDAESWAPLKAE